MPQGTPTARRREQSHHPRRHSPAAQRHTSGERGRAQRPGGKQVAGAQGEERSGHHPESRSPVGRQDADRLSDRVVGGPLEQRRDRPTSNQQDRRTPRRKQGPPRHKLHQTTIKRPSIPPSCTRGRVEYEWAGAQLNATWTVERQVMAGRSAVGRRTAPRMPEGADRKRRPSGCGSPPSLHVGQRDAVAVPPASPPPACAATSPGQAPQPLRHADDTRTAPRRSPRSANRTPSRTPSRARSQRGRAAGRTRGRGRGR